MGVCDACGNDEAYVSRGGVLLCSICAVDVEEEIDRLRAAGQPVDVVKIARRMYRESHH